MTHTQLRACSHKIGYSSERIAHLGHAQFVERTGDHRVKPYRCPFCTMWHLGHPSNRGPVAQPAAPSFLTILRRNTQAAVDRVCWGPLRLMTSIEGTRKVAFVTGMSQTQDLVRHLNAVQCVEVIELFESLADGALTWNRDIRQRAHHSRRQNKDFRRRRLESRGAA